MAQFVWAADKDGDCFKNIGQKFCTVTHGKQKAGVFTGPQISKLIRDTLFDDSMNQLEEKKSMAELLKCCGILPGKQGGQIKRILCKICWRT
jgi:hypothetical protein